MKIFFIIRGLHDAGGIERITSVVTSELSKRGYEIGIICLEKGEPFFSLHKNIQVHYIKSTFFRKNELKKIYEAEKPDINIFLGSHRSMLNIPASKGIPSITWEHFNSNINWHPLHKYSRKLAVKHCDKIVVLTQKDVYNYQKKWNAKNVICISNPLTINNIPRSPLDKKRILAVGRLSSQKGFDLLLDSWHQVKCKEFDWKLRIVGSGSHQEKLQKKIEKFHLQDSVKIVPATKDICSEYQNASAFVMSSRFEGLPLVLIEAMSAGLPIVSFNCETGPEEIVVDGKTGILVPPLNTSLLAKAIDDLLMNEEKLQQFSESSLIQSQKFSLGNIISNWEELFKEIAQKHSILLS